MHLHGTELNQNSTLELVFCQCTTEDTHQPIFPVGSQLKTSASIYTYDQRISILLHNLFISRGASVNVNAGVECEWRSEGINNNLLKK